MNAATFALVFAALSGVGAADKRPIAAPRELPARCLALARDIVLVPYYLAGSTGGGVRTMFAARPTQRPTSGCAVDGVCVRIPNWRT